jgi:hypothetical protein
MPKYGVFIVESLTLEDENNNRMDGKILKQILDLCKIENTYFYIRTEAEFTKILELFKESEYGFFHLSCHGNNKELCFTLDQIEFESFATLYGSYFYERRLFLSCCESTCFEFAKHLLPRFHPYSIIGSPDKIRFDTSAVFWSSFYYKMIELGAENMNQEKLKKVLSEITVLFKVRINYYSIISSRYPISIDHLNAIIYDGENANSKQETIKTPYNDLYPYRNKK